MRLVIRGHHLPGRSFESFTNVHVGLQVGREPSGLVAGDAEAASWETEIHVVDGDYRGPAVQGRRGDRFVYLTWGEVSGDEFTMFRRAKLMLDDVAMAGAQEVVTVEVDLTAADGTPRCARLLPPAVKAR